MLFLPVALAALAAQPTAPTDPHPLQPLAAWFSDSDYPADAIRRGASGIVGFRLQVGADGVPTGCTITAPADPELDQTTCRILMTRARFTPGHNRRGRAVPGSAIGRIRWVLPEEGHNITPFIALHIANVITLNASGNITCSLSLNGGAAEQRVEEDCGFFSGSGAAAAFRARGTPGDLILIYVRTPDGMALAPSIEEAGADLGYEDTARLIIGPDGRLVECRPGQTRILRTPLPFGLPQACPPVGALMTTVSTSQEPREAFAAVRLYTRP